MDESIRQSMRLWTSVQPMVSAFIASVIRDHSDRDDVLQNIAVAVMESFESYDLEKPFLGWAIGISKNHLRIYLREKRRNKLVLDDESIQQIAAAMERVEEDKVRQFDFLRDCFKSLDERDRQLCVLRYEDDLKPAAIATLVDLSANAVAKALQRVRERLKKCIKHKAAMQGGSS